MKTNKLHNIKTTGFKTPNDYFESFEAKLEERLTKKETIHGVETTGYTVPNDYFETFGDALLNKLKPKENQPVIVLNSKRKLYYIAGIAASFIILFSLIINNKNSISIDAIDTLAIESYIYQEDFTNDDLASLFNTNELSESDFIDVNISDDTLDQYLDHIDTEDLIID